MRFYPVSIGVALLILSSKSSYADFKWTQPTAAELTMTSEPKAPGAPAILLLYEESADASTSEALFHLRIKVLSHGGLDAANIQLADPLIQGA